MTGRPVICGGYANDGENPGQIWTRSRGTGVCRAFDCLLRARPCHPVEEGSFRESLLDTDHIRVEVHRGVFDQIPNAHV